MVDPTRMQGHMWSFSNQVLFALPAAHQQETAAAIRSFPCSHSPLRLTEWKVGEGTPVMI